MPNWVDNKLIVTGPAEKVKEFRDQVTVEAGQDKYTPEQRETIERKLEDLRIKVESTPEEFRSSLERNYKRQYADFQADLRVQTHHSDLSLNKLVPIPAELLYGDFGSGMDAGWYAWSVENWGTKWDVDGASIEWWKDNTPHGDSICYTFLSAWAPPTAWAEKASEQFPELEFELSFDDPSIDLAGTEVFAAGVATMSVQGPSPSRTEWDETEEEEDELIEVL